MKFTSIRYRLVLSITLFIALILVAIAVGAYAYFWNATQKLIFDQQFSMITSMAHDLDRRITSAHKALINVASDAPPDIVNNHEATQTWLNNRSGTRTIFSHIMIVLDNSGTLIASTPAIPEKHGTSFAYRDYFTATMDSGKPSISEPFITVANDRPVVMMTAPIRAKDGSIKGLLCGAVDLLDDDGMFGAIKNARIGTSGYLYMYAPDRTMIMHPDHSRIMKQDVKPGANVLFDKALDGFEGSGATVNSRGESFLASFKRLQTTGWILAANYRLSEAFAPITRFRNYFLFGMFIALLSAVALAWKLGGGFARPLEGFVAQLKLLAQPGSDRKQRLDSRRADEIGLLAASFNTLLDEVQRNEQELKEAQIQLMQSEKLASVGQLAAGVAHEINNPIGFINSNLGSLKGQVNDLLSVIAAYEQAEGILSAHPDTLEIISKAKSAADLDFVREDILNLITESLDGVRRVKTIVENLKDFSRVDSAEWQYANLENGLDSTLNIVWNEIKDKVEVIKDYAGLPEIECIASQINQAFMNLLVNAAYAIQEHGSITLRTGFDDTQVWIEIEDTGTGIKPEHMDKIFEPFFTTKPVGQGTGLGLSLAYGIVQLHHGRLVASSEWGKGSLFRLTLPRKSAKVGTTV